MFHQMFNRFDKMTCRSRPGLSRVGVPSLRRSYVGAGVAAMAAVVVSPASAQSLVGPTDAWFGIDGLQITYSGGVGLFDVRFDQRPFDEVYGPGAPNLLFSSGADVESALQALGDFLNGPPLADFQLAPIVPYPGTVRLSDGFIYPLEMTESTILLFGNIDYSGPLGWRYFVRTDTGVIERTVDLVQSGRANQTWAVFTLVPTPQGDLNLDCVVDTADLGILIAAFGSTELVGDINGDGIVDTADLGILVSNFSATCEDL